MANHIIIGIGEILWDEFPQYRELGGAPANFAFHANQLGATGMVVSQIGNDPAGQEIKILLEKKQIPYLLPEDFDHPTGRVSVTTDDKGTPAYLIHENSSWDFLSFNPALEKIAKIADVVCFGSLAQRNPVSGKAIINFIKATKKNCLKIFDINLRQHYYSKKKISELLELTDILKLNHEELDVLSKMFLSSQEETACLEEIKSLFNVNLIVLTKGKNGSRIFMNKNHDSHHQPKLVEVVDSVGAGDSFSAVVALGLLKGFSLEKINEIANTVATYICSNKGATPVIPIKIIQSLN